MEKLITLTDKSTRILMAIAAGFSSAEIIAQRPGWSNEDVSIAAREALDLAGETRSLLHQAELRRQRKMKMKERHPRAGAHWRPDELQKLRELVNAGKELDEIAEALQRNSTAVFRRMLKSNMITLKSMAVQ